MLVAIFQEWCSNVPERNVEIQIRVLLTESRDCTNSGVGRQTLLPAHREKRVLKFELLAISIIVQ